MTMDAGPGSTALATSTPMVPLTFQVAAAPFHGLYDDRAGRIFVNEDLTDVAPLRITIAHEIGHAFGLPHVSASVRRSLMNTGNTTVSITPEDVDALAAIWGRCPPAATASP
jgi:Zn-dependent peptidase ImmA (M78 family)